MGWLFKSFIKADALKLFEKKNDDFESHKEGLKNDWSLLVKFMWLVWWQWSTYVIWVLAGDAFFHF